MLSGSFRRAGLAVRLAHVYLDIGEPVRAGEVAESTLEADDEALRPDELIELMTTQVACLYEKGELTRAYLLARRVIEDAEKNRSPRGRAAAYWEAGLVAERRGDLRNARIWTERALTLYAESDNARAAASLRYNWAWVILRCPDADLALVKTLLRRAATDLSECGTQLDVAKAETELARCLLLEGDAEAAASTVTAALNRMHERHHMEEAPARMILARALATTGDRDGAVRSYRAAFALLDQIDGGRDTAVAWRELADGLLAIGLVREGIAAYKRSADAAGVRTAPTSTDNAAAAGTARQDEHRRWNTQHWIGLASSTTPTRMPTPAQALSRSDAASLGAQAPRHNEAAVAATSQSTQQWMGPSGEVPPTAISSDDPES